MTAEGGRTSSLGPNVYAGGVPPVADPAEANNPSAPNVFIVGAAKAGTTAIATWLAAAGCYLPPIKEPHFLAGVAPGPSGRGTLAVVRDWHAYRALYASAGQSRLRMDASTSYLPFPNVAAAIRDLWPRARVVIALRNPAERAYSHYLNNVREGIERRGFHEAIEDELSDPAPTWVFNAYVGLGHYAAQVGPYSEALGDSLCVVCFEELLQPDSGELRRLARFLDVGGSAAATLPLSNPYARHRWSISSRLLGSARVRQASRRLLPVAARRAVRAGVLDAAAKPPMDMAVRDVLERHYRPEIAALETVLGRSLPW